MKKEQLLKICRYILLSLILLFSLSKQNPISVAADNNGSIQQEFNLSIDQFPDTETQYRVVGIGSAEPNSNLEILKPDLSPPTFTEPASNLAEELDWHVYLPLVFNTSAQFECPQEGNWAGKTSQNRDIVFSVEEDPSCKITYGSLSINYRDNCGFTQTITFNSEFNIIEKHFETGLPNASVVGDFTSPITAAGTFYHKMPEPGYPGFYCIASVTWTANYIP